MNDVPDRDRERDRAEVNPGQRDELAELRRLLMGVEQSRIEEILLRLNDPDTRAHEIGRILPEAILKGAGEDKRLVSALMPTVEEIIDLSVKRNPWKLVDSLFPVMGPAIRKSISEALKTMVQSLNQVLEHSLSSQSLRWRIESLRTGKPFAEIVLLHSLVFRVEQVFLIHRQTGLLLCHVKAESVVFQDADLVSGMLTAIEDFVRDSFDASQWESLENLQIGELMVFIEHGPLAYLAAVVRGSAPADLSSRLKGTLEMIHLEFHQALESFDGNTGAFQTAAGRLEDCLQNSYRTEGKKVFPYFKVLSVALSATVAAWVLLEVRAGLRWKSYLERLRAEKGLVVVSWEKKDAKYVVTGLRDPLAADPASFVTASGLDPGRVVGRWELVQTMEPEFVLARARKTLDPPETVSLSLKDGVVTAEGSAGYQWIMDARRLARSLPGVREYQDDQLTVAYDAELEMIRKQLAPPETVSLSLKDAVLTARGSAPYRWIIDTRALARLLPGIQEYQDRELSIDYDSVLRRIKEELSPPNTVSLRIVDGVLWAAGSAPREWIAQAKRNLRGFPEISAYRDDQLRDQDKDRLEGLAAAISRMTLSYEKNMSRLAPGQETGLSDLVSSSLSLQALAGKLAVRFRIHVKGHTDSTGSEAENTRLSKKRAEEMAAHLASQGVQRTNISTEGMGAAEPLVAEASEKARTMNRRASFAVIFEEQPPERGH